MPTSEIFEIFGLASNAVVAKSPGRNFPGMLIQGDTLRSILEEVDELKADAIAENLEGVKDSAEALRERFIELLTYYEDMLNQNGIALPYLNRVKKG